MINVQNLMMRYGNFVALDRISFTAHEKEVLGLLGPNGAGKTTAMRILTTYLYPSAGTATIQGIDIVEHPLEVRNLIGYLPETAPLYPDMQVDEYLRFVGEARGLDKVYLKKRLDWVTQSCDIGSVWKHSINELSKGYKQRVGLAQALIHDPKVLILDEPTSGLDPLQIIGIRDLIKKLAQEKTILFSTHILQEVEAVANQIVIINNGKIISRGSKSELEAEVRKFSSKQGALSLEDIFIELLTAKKRKGTES